MRADRDQQAPRVSEEIDVDRTGLVISGLETCARLPVPQHGRSLTRAELQAQALERGDEGRRVVGPAVAPGP